MDKAAFFWQIQAGTLPPPPSAVTLGMRIRNVSAEAGTIEVEFEAKPEFTNPAGHIQGGFLAAMLDDTMGPALAATLGAGEFAPTLNLNVSFAKPATVGTLQGRGRIVRRGKEVCFLAAELYQETDLIASATATAIIRKVAAAGSPIELGESATRADQSRVSGTAAERIYQFRITLRDVAPPVWRIILVPETYSFWDLHVAITDAMGWLDYHLHAFHVVSPDGKRPLRIGIPDDSGFEGDEPIEPGWEVPITRHFTRPGVTVQYDYDFGDGWEHDVILEAISERQAGLKYPLCVGGARACPPEDCGGPSGYENLLEVIRDPGHEEHESVLQWLGGRFDPEKFDPGRVKFDDPGRRWKTAFGARLPARSGGRRATGKRRGRR
jgi:uncharacterized protein (TIGR00369 family)